MRFETPVYFQRITETYDPATGDHTETVTEQKLYAAVTDAGTDTVAMFHGDVRAGALVLRLQEVPRPFDRIRIGTERYKVETGRRLRRLQVYIITEVQG